MSALDTILHLVSVDIPAAGIDCLLIGGFAVNHYGYTRNTLDIDFMVATDRIHAVCDIMRANGFINIDQSDNTIFVSRPGEAFRADFLKVDAMTQEKLLRDAGETIIRGCRVRLPCLRDLLAMKIHALTQNTPQRMGKDLPDIAYLSVLHNLSFESDLRPLCDRYGTPEVCRMIQEQITGLTA